MAIFGAIGLGLTIVILKNLVEPIFMELEETLIQLFVTVQSMLDLVQATMYLAGPY